jgi:hypothetical protein
LIFLIFFKRDDCNCYIIIVCYYYCLLTDSNRGSRVPHVVFKNRQGVKNVFITRTVFFTFIYNHNSWLSSTSYNAHTRWPTLFCSMRLYCTRKMQTWNFSPTNMCMHYSKRDCKQVCGLYRSIFMNSLFVAYTWTHDKIIKMVKTAPREHDHL